MKKFEEYGQTFLSVMFFVTLIVLAFTTVWKALGFGVIAGAIALIIKLIKNSGGPNPPSAPGIIA